MATVYGFNHEKDIDRVLRMLDSFERSKGRSVVSPSSVRQEARYAKILTLIKIPEAGEVKEGEAPPPDIKDKQATGIEVAWNSTAYDFTVVSKDPVKYDDALLQKDEATVFSTNNITSKTAMKVGQIVLLQKYPNISKTSGWLVVETGGSSRAYVVITAQTPSTDEEGEVIEGEFESDVYKGDLLTSPTDLTVVTADIVISVPGAVSNPFAVGYSNFADVVDGVYYLDGTLLG